MVLRRLDHGRLSHHLVLLPVNVHHCHLVGAIGTLGCVWRGFRVGRRAPLHHFVLLHLLGGRLSGGWLQCRCQVCLASAIRGSIVGPQMLVVLCLLNGLLIRRNQILLNGWQSFWRN